MKYSVASPALSAKPLQYLLGLLLTLTLGLAHADAPPATQVKTETIQLTHVELRYDYPGRVQSPHAVEIHARASGELLEQLYNDGDQVEQGQLLYKIDPSVYQAQYQRAQSQLAMERAKLNQSEREKKRVEGLYRDNAVSQQERDNAVSAYELARASVKAARAQLQQTQIDLDYTEVRAPIGGITGMKQQTVGSLVGREYGATWLTTITQLDPIEIHFSIGEREFVERQQAIMRNELRYSQGDTPGVQVTYLGQTLSGELNFSDHTVDQHTGSVKLRASFHNPQHLLLPGSFVRVQLTGIEAVDVVVIPQTAVLQVGTQAFVYVVKDHQAQLVPVTLGEQLPQAWIIRDGLQPGDQLIVNNLMQLRPGVPVRVQNDTTDPS